MTSGSTKKSPFTVNSSLLPAKALNFFNQGALCMWHKFIYLHMRNIGLTTAETGVIVSVYSFLQLAVAPLFGGFADKYNAHKSTVIAACIVSAALMFSILFVPPKYTPKSCLDNVNVCFSMSNESTLNETSSDENTNVNNLCERAKQRDSEYICTYNGQKGAFRYGHGTSLMTNEQFCFNVTCVESDLHKESSKLTIPSNLFSIVNTTSIKLIKHCNLRIETSYQLHIVSQNEYSETCENNMVKKDKSISNDFKATFWIIFIIYTLATLLKSSTVSLMYALMYTILRDRWAHWGKQRLWGSVSVVITAIGATLLLDAYSEDQENIPYEICFYILIAEVLLCAVSTFLFRIQNPVYVGSVWKGSLQLLGSFQTLSLCITVTIFGMFMGATEFLLWHLTSQEQSKEVLDNKQIIFGVHVSLGCLLEIPVFYFSGRLIQKLGHINCLGISSLAYGLRLLSYSFIKNPWLILCTAPFNPFCYGLIECTSSSYARFMAPPGLSAVSQSVVAAFYTGLGVGSGTLLTGFLFDRVGSAWTYRLYAYSSFGFLLPFIILQWFLFRKRDITQQRAAQRDECVEIRITEIKDSDSECVKLDT